VTHRSCRHLAQEGGHLDAQLVERAFAGSWSGADEQVAVGEQVRAGASGDEGAQAAAETVAGDGVADGTADREGDRRWRDGGVAEVPTPEGLGAGAAAMTLQSLERSALVDPTDQADRRERPLSRRALMIERPARVRIRARNPCLRALRRVFGW
jgi:hypothetical protein